MQPCHLSSCGVAPRVVCTACGPHFGPRRRRGSGAQRHGAASRADEMIAYTRLLIDAFKGTTLERLHLAAVRRWRCADASRRPQNAKAKLAAASSSTQAHTVSYQLITLYTDS